MFGKKIPSQTENSESQSGQLGRAASSSLASPTASGATSRPSQPQPAQSQPRTVSSDDSVTGPTRRSGSQAEPTSGQRGTDLNPTARPFQPVARSVHHAPPSLPAPPSFPARPRLPPKGPRSQAHGCWPRRPESQRASSTRHAPPTRSSVPHRGRRSGRAQDAWTRRPESQKASSATAVPPTGPAVPHRGRGGRVQGAWPPREDTPRASSARHDLGRQTSPIMPHASRNGRRRRTPSPRHESLPRAPRHFVPSRAAQAHQETAENAALRKEMAEAMGFSENYQGNPYARRNQDPDIPEEDNCSFWITKLPPNVTVHMLLGSIRGVGRIYSTYINEPMSMQGGQTYCAAKVTFFELRAARRFWAMCQQHGTPERPLLPVGYHRAQVQYNRHRSAEVANHHATRCIVVQGPESWVRLDNLRQFFDHRFVYQIDDMRVAHGLNGFLTVEVRFGSWRSQAESAMQALLMDSPENVVAWYARDPCDL